MTEPIVCNLATEIYSLDHIRCRGGAEILGVYPPKVSDKQYLLVIDSSGEIISVKVFCNGRYYPDLQKTSSYDVVFKPLKKLFVKPLQKLLSERYFKTDPEGVTYKDDDFTAYIKYREMDKEIHTAIRGKYRELFCEEREV